MAPPGRVAWQQQQQARASSKQQPRHQHRPPPTTRQPTAPPPENSTKLRRGQGQGVKQGVLPPLIHAFLLRSVCAVCEIDRKVGTGCAPPSCRGVRGAGRAPACSYIASSYHIKGPIVLRCMLLLCPQSVVWETVALPACCTQCPHAIDLISSPFVSDEAGKLARVGWPGCWWVLRGGNLRLAAGDGGGLELA